MTKAIKKLPDSELETMLAVWRAEAPVRGSEVAAALAASRGWNKSTVFTLLLRLVEKGFLSCEKEGKNNLYQPLVNEADYRAHESRSMLDRFYAGSLKNFVAAFCSEEPLSRSDLEELRQLVEEKTREL